MNVTRTMAWLNRGVHRIRQGCSPLRRPFWSLAYSLYGRIVKDEYPFMNYGYEPEPGEMQVPDLAPQDEPERVCIQMYHRVATLVEGADALRGKDVLEVGCGRGGGASYLARYLSPRRMVGVDLGRTNIATCRRAHSSPNLEFLQGDAQALPLPDSSVDVVVNVESSHAYPSFDRFLAEVARVLRPGGWLLLADVRDAEALRGFEESLAAAPWEPALRRSLAEGVVRSMQRDGERRRQAVLARFPRPLQQPFLCFCGVPGSPVHRALQEGRADYPAVALRKT